jgi:periplasmic protein TonB
MIPLKEAQEAGEVPVSQGTNLAKPGSGQLRSDAVSLDVPVKVHGSRVVEVIRGTTSHTEPFEEQASTMIVFPLGGVLKMTTQVNVGQAIVLTNLKTRQDAICRVVKIRTNPNLHSYVEIEFSHPQPGYWGVRFPSDGPEPAKKAASPAAASIAPAPVRPAPPVPAAISTPVPKVEAPKAEIPKIEIKEQKTAPPAPAGIEKSAAAFAPPSSSPVETSASAGTADSASFSLEQLRGDVGAVAAKPFSNIERLKDAETHGNTESLVADEASAAHEPSTFGRFAASAALSGEAAARPAFGAGLEYSPLGATADKGQKQGKNWALIAACVGLLLVAAGAGGFYFTHQRPGIRSFAVAAPAVPEGPVAANPISNSASATAAPVPETPAAAAPAETAPTGAPVGTPPVVTRTRRAEPDKVSKAAPSEPAPSPTQSPFQSRASESAKQKSAAVVPDMFGALNAHPTTAVHSSSESGAAPSIDPGALASGQSIALPSSEPSPANLAPPPQPAPERPVEVGGDLKPPRLISSSEVAYPEIARQAGIQGNVVVRIVIDKTGKVTEAKAIYGPLMLRDAAANALRQRKYAPSKLDGHPISVEMLVTIEFHR